MGRLALPSRLLSGSSQLLLMLMLGTIARVANGCQIAGVQVSARSETTITVTWTEVGVDATSYILKLYQRFIFTSFTVYGSASNFTFTGLVPNSYYNISITVNCTGGSYVSPTLSDSTLPPKVNVTITGKTMTSMSFSWEVPSPSLNYIARLEDDNNINQSSSVQSPDSITFINLIPDTNYYAYVETINLYCSKESDVVMDRTLPAKVNVSTIAKNATTITVSWNMSSVDLYLCIASLKERQDGPNIKFQTMTTLPESVTFTGLVPGRNYFVFVTIYILTTNTISVTFTERTLPPTPTLSITANTMTTMTVSWAAPASDVDYYLVYLRETANGTLVKTNNVTSRPATFNELVPGRNYSLSIEAHSADLSQLSDAVMSRTLPPQVNVTISVISHTAMTVSWVAPISDVDYYVVYLSETYNATAMKSVILSSTITTTEFTDLISDRSYDASVTAYSGIYFKPSTIITRTTLPSDIVLTITSKTTTTITLSMTTSLPYSFSYLANLTETVSGNLVTISPIYPTMATFTGLVPGRKYSVSVEGSNGSFSSLSYIVIVRTFPPQVNVTIIVNSPTAMTVSWVAPTSDVDYYVVYLNETYNATAVKSFILPSTVTTQEFTDLVSSRSYNASVTVYSGINSQPSDIVSNITYASIRLAGSNIPCQGRVEVFHNGEWGTVCDDFWNSQDAKVVCHQLGCALNGVAISNAYFGQGSVPIFLDNVQCSGYEIQLSDCRHRPWGIHDCVHNKDASVICSQVPVSSYIILTITNKTTTTMAFSWTNSVPELFSYSAYLTEIANETLVKTFRTYSTMATFTGLVPGRRYSVSVEGSNGSFSSWSDMVMVRTFPPQVNVTVIVNSPTAMTVSWVAPTSDVDYYVVYLNETYNATSVKSFILPSTFTSQTFTDLFPGRSYNASVTVYSGINSQPSDIVTNITYMSIRLAGSNTTCQGRVEVFHNDEWGTVCDDFWSPEDAKVVCRQLGCGLTAFAMSYAHFGKGSGPIWLDNVECSGYETQLSNCSHLPWGMHDCSHYEDASVICLQVSSYIVLTITNKTTNTMTVSGTTYLPYWFDYWAYLRETASGNLVTIFQIYSTTATFTRLVPGMNYSVTMEAYDGLNSYWSDVVMDRTLPSNIVLTIISKTTTTMTVSRTTYLPDSFSYWASLTDTESGHLVTTFQINSTTATFTDLVPGRNYSVSVQASDGSASYWSDVVMDRTLSSNIVLTITSKTTTTMTVSRTTYLPDSFSYWAYLTDTESGNLITTFQINSTTATFTHLVPGRNYSVSVQASDGSASYWSDVVMDRTYPASVRDFSCFTYSSENISCSWSLPVGVWSLLYLQVINTSKPLQTVGVLNDNFTVITKYSLNETITEPQGNGRTNLTFAMLGRLKPNTEYLVNITTFSEYVLSRTLQGKARTDVSAPPPVPETVNITTVQNQVTPSSLTISFSCSWFQKTNGDLKYYTVIVKQSEEINSESPEKRWPLSTYSEYASGSTNVYQVDDRVYPSECSNPNSVVSVQIGTGRTSGSFSDGPLKQNTAYRISFRVYTYLPNARSVRAGGVAIYTDTRFSLPLMTLVGDIGSSGSIIGPVVGAVVGGVVGGVLGAFVIIVGGVLLYIRRKQLNCFKKPDSTQQTGERKWGELPAVPGGMKKDVCDASHKVENEYMSAEDCIYEDLDNSEHQEDHHSGAPSKTGEDDVKTVGSSDPTYLAPDNVYVNVK